MLPYERIRRALIKGCMATSAEHIVVDVSQVIEVIGYDACDLNDLFNWVANTEAVLAKKIKPNSIIPLSSLVQQVGYGEANRELLLELLQQTPETREGGTASFPHAVPPTTSRRDPSDDYDDPSPYKYRSEKWDDGQPLSKAKHSPLPPPPEPLDPNDLNF